MHKVIETLARFGKDDGGAPATEYALMAAFIALVMAVGAGVLGGGLNTVFTNIGNTMATAQVPTLPNPVGP